ncbi:folylpolyglutamate synthase/dihydrofolate synthase family protein [Peribacillus frigoritolerans]|uniref:bifunctional folylpolyglutamate synthase/dihydrofolate synthase n=1 Tax=Peribacillus frigoritolerans TaxID=450367 RepID=UPI002E21EA81|nr:bifunctional folylpolyglutamate synthase/dihydrofolate synthase [Peribacillus frigoritolerans]MED3847379.1 bifunctional folylpolyglutamate synthase/dihydrofolate synthase [Peribacillus frigoritolerans]
MVTTMKEINQFFERRQVRLGMNFGLSRMETLLTELGDPHKELKYIHIAGSNGKGSTLQYIKEILLAQGIRVASFTSPYLIRMNEQLKVNEDEISDQDFIDVFRKLWPIIHEMDSKGSGPTQFEILTAMAFSYFSKKEVDLVLMETGLGGRLDTTNVIQPFLSIITSISLEHTNILGNTLGEIAFEKAGIIKSGAPVISGVTAGEPAKVIEEKASALGVPYYQLGKDFRVCNMKRSERGQSFSFALADRSIENVEMRMLGRHQMENAALAIAAVTVGMENIDEKSILKGIGAAKWDGRFEKISDEPLVIIDGAHNPAGIDVLKETLKVHYPDYKYRFVFSSFKDKNYSEMLHGLETGAMEIIITEFDHERAADAKTLYEKCNHPNKSINKDWQAAITEGRRKTGDKEILVITGSLHFLSLVREFLIREDA